MRLSPAAELAIRGTVVLASEYGNGPATLESICSRRDLPRQYLVKIFASLARAGLVTPVRGKNGGYLLARSPEQINLLQVIEAVEGPLALNYCQQNPSQCDEQQCPIRSVWDELQDTMRTKLGEMTLAHCMNRTSQSASLEKQS